MKIRFATPEDLAAVRRIWKICFGDTEAYMNLFFSAVYNRENTLIAADGDRVIGTLQMFFREFLYEGRKLPAAYIGGVAVMPEYRNGGIASRLMLAAEDVLSKTGVSVLFLAPATFSIYRRLGYSPLSCLSDFSGKTEALSPFIAPDSALYETDKPPQKIYDTFQRKCSLSLMRNAEIYRKAFVLCENASLMVTPDENGYLLFRKQNDCLLGLECIFETEAALREILGFIWTQRDAFPTFRLRMPTFGDTRRVLFDKAFTETRYPHVMVKALSGDIPLYSEKNYINMLGWF